MSISKIDQAKAALKVFFCAVVEWDLSDKEAQLLLNNINQHDYDSYKIGNIESVSDDILFRLAHLTMIYGSLRLLFSDENIILWLRNESDLKSKWQGHSPLEFMTNSLEGIIQTANHLQTLSGE